LTPERRRDFENEWPELARRLSRFLARKGVDFSDVDDLVQETGLRLYGMWGEIDQTRGSWPLASTIALNLVRDRGRRRPIREIASGDVPDTPDLYEVERAGLARVELGRIELALASLSASHRSALLMEVGNGVACAAKDSEAARMLRMRARRRLTAMLEKVSAVVLPLRPSRLNDLIEWVFGSRQVALSTVSCVLCVALGAVTAFSSALVPPRAFAQGAPGGVVRGGAVLPDSAVLPSRVRAARLASSSDRAGTANHEGSGVVGQGFSKAPASSGVGGGGGIPKAPVPDPGPAPHAPRVPLPTLPIPDSVRTLRHTIASAVSHATRPAGVPLPSPGH
jgi:DNA-directed RNA polymerase specialized sigma24 family protein